ncbi:MAG: bifunctional 2-polyprenyl-6-hydroxyphenol methylase/3-demethylubiquinol 3-O-methyltransferase UbiG [Bacillota bacterium]
MDIEVAKISEDVTSDLYRDLAEEWYSSQTGPMAIARAETRAQLPWILERIRKYIGYRAEILDVGSGAGFFSNEAARAGHQVTGLDMSETSLKVAELMDQTGLVRYVEGDAYRMPFAKESFDVVVALDLLEHVSDPEQIMSEMTRVLRPGGLLFFHTINKTAFSYALVFKKKWFVRNTPLKYYDYSLFRSPEMIDQWCTDLGLEIQTLQGLRPKIMTKSFWRWIWNREVPENLQFVWGKSKVISYTGCAKKLREH